MDQGQFTIHKAEFIEDVAKFMEGKSVDTVLEGLNEQHRRFKMLEGQMMQRKARLMTKLPEIQKALDIVNTLVAKSSVGEEMVIDFELAESVYAKTKVNNVKTVNLWLGADVMVEYSIEEAKVSMVARHAHCLLRCCIINTPNWKWCLQQLQDLLCTQHQLSVQHQCILNSHIPTPWLSFLMGALS